MINIIANDVQGDITNTADVICSVPQNRLPVEFIYVVGIYTAKTLRTGRFQIVYQIRNIKGRMYVDKKMHMILFAAKLYKTAPPTGKDLRKGRS